MTVPFIVRKLLATMVAVLPNLTLSRYLSELMRRGNLPNAGFPRFAEMGIALRELAAELKVRLIAPVE